MSKKVLVVDDEVACTMFLGLYLKDAGYDVKTCTDGEEAITLGKEFQPDTLISDWMLKNKNDGLDVARALIEVRPDIQIIFITGMAADALEQKLDGLPVYRIVEKPLNLDQIVKLIEREDSA